MSEPEPRRSVRSTKGQHNQRAADPLDQPLEPKRRGSKKSNKRQADPEPEPEEEEEEVIRCVCGATSQDTVDPEDPEDPWIACDSCHVWQHNVCVGMSVFDEDLENIEYFCEECKPEAHKELLDGRAKGKKVWEIRRQEFTAQKAAEKQKKKAPPKKGKKGKTEIPDDARASHAKSSASPAPAPEKKSKSAAAKRKERHDSADTNSKEPSKLRKVSESVAQPASHPAYEPPADLPDAITELPELRQGPAKLLQKSLLHSIAQQHDKKKGEGDSTETRALRLAIAIERAVHDHSQQEYIKQCRSLAANLKSNLDLTSRLIDGTLTPPMLAVMSSDELQTDKMQQETAAAKERSVRQSVIATDDTGGPRIRKTHKGDELVNDTSDAPPTPQRPLPKIGSSSRVQQSHSRKPSGDTPQASNFDIKKVMDGVNKSPTVAHRRRPSGPAPSQVPIEDAEVDRLLEDDGPGSPPYSPADEDPDPDVVWRGQLFMPGSADFKVKAKHVAGANLLKTLEIPWTSLLPDKLVVGGRIAINSATEYLCSLRWSAQMDLVIVSLEPARDEGKQDFDRIADYFRTRERWAVVGEKRHANVKDTYLIPVPAGTGNMPEFLLNLEDNFFPATRTQDALLLVIVYRNDEATLRKISAELAAGAASGVPNHASPSPAPHNGLQRTASAAGPGYSPTTPHVGAGGSGQPQPGTRYNQGPNNGALSQAQFEGEAMARSILGPFASAPTLVFLMPHAHQMSSSEWQIIRRVLEQEPKARDDLNYLGLLISRESESGSRQQSFPPPQGQQATQQAAQQSVPQPAQQPAQQPSIPAGTPNFQAPQAQPLHNLPHQQYGGPSAAAGVSPGAPSATPSQLPPRQTPISLPPIAGMPASVHQSYHQAQAERQARDVQSPPASVLSSAAPPQV